VVSCCSSFAQVSATLQLVVLLEVLERLLNSNLEHNRVTYDEKIIEYYSEAGMDYEPWSRNFNMHFGYYRWGLMPFDREAMLNEMSRQVVLRLRLDSQNESRLIDLGCGVGATARHVVRHFDNIHVLGGTIVPWQIQQARLLSSDAFYSNRVSFDLLDYRNLHLAENSFDGAYAMESACYDFGKDKRRFLQESFRVLKPGSKLVVADGFTKGQKHTRFFSYLYRKVCAGWVLEDFAGIDEFVSAMQDIGFEDIQVEDVSWRVALSVAFVPWVSVKYFFKTILFGKGNKRVQLGHFIAPVYGLLMGLHRGQYGYHIVHARKPH